MSITATLFVAPYGQKQALEIEDIDEADELWFVENNAKLSAEEVNGQYVVYADVGLTHDDGEPNEAIEISRGRTCRETMHALRVMAERMLEGK